MCVCLDMYVGRYVCIDMVMGERYRVCTCMCLCMHSNVIDSVVAADGYSYERQAECVCVCVWTCMYVGRYV